MTPPECPPISLDGKHHPVKPATICACCTYPAVVFVPGYGGLCGYHAQVQGVLPGRVTFTDVEPAPTEEDTQPGAIDGRCGLWTLLDDYTED